VSGSPILTIFYISIWLFLPEAKKAATGRKASKHTLPDRRAV